MREAAVNLFTKTQTQVPTCVFFCGLLSTLCISGPLTSKLPTRLNCLLENLRKMLTGVEYELAKFTAHPDI